MFQILQEEGMEDFHVSFSYFPSTSILVSAMSVLFFVVSSANLKFHYVIFKFLIFCSLPRGFLCISAFVLILYPPLLYHPDCVSKKLIVSWTSLRLLVFLTYLEKYTFQKYIFSLTLQSNASFLLCTGPQFGEF